MNLHHIREEYRQQSLSIKQCAENPMVQFEQWLNEAMEAKVCEPTAMHIATVQNGIPSSRVVLLKEVKADGFVFFTNYQSKKGKAIAENPAVALTFFWPELERQVRVEGKAKKLPDSESCNYFASRPYQSQIGAWASEQSQIIENKAELLSKALVYSAKYPLKVPRPAHWGGYLIEPERIEFWQGRPSRLHDRIFYQRDTQNGWCKVRLSP